MDVAFFITLQAQTAKWSYLQKSLYCSFFQWSWQVSIHFIYILFLWQLCWILILTDQKVSITAALIGKYFLLQTKFQGYSNGLTGAFQLKWSNNCKVSCLTIFVRSFMYLFIYFHYSGHFCVMAPNKFWSYSCLWKPQYPGSAYLKLLGKKNDYYIDINYDWHTIAYTYHWGLKYYYI